MKPPEERLNDIESLPSPSDPSVLPRSRAEPIPGPTCRLPAALHSGVSGAAGPFLAAPGASHRKGGTEAAGGLRGRDVPCATAL